MEVLDFLREASFFRGLSAGSQEALSRIAFLRPVKKREILFLEGDEGHSLYLLAEGSVQLYKTSAEGVEIVIKIIDPLEVFAEVILFEQSRFPVSAVTLTESLLLQFPKRHVHTLLEERDFRNDFIAMLLRKQRYLADRIYFFSALDVEERLLHFLKEQSQGETAFSIPYSKKEIATAIGTTPETLSRLLLKLETEKVLHWEKNRIQLL